MAKTNSYRKQWLRYHKSYEKRALKRLRLVFREWVKDIPFDKLNSDYKKQIEKAVKEDLISDAVIDIYTQIGLIHGKKVGANINKQIKLFSFGDFESDFLDMLMDFLNKDGGKTIKTIRRTFIDDIIRLISQAQEDGEGIRETAREIQKKVNKRGFYRWQAERIARTESTSAANMAALQAGLNSGIVMDKVWISSTDKRTRRIPEDEFDHLAMDEVKVRATKNFKVPSKDGPEDMMFPGDPKGSAGNVINCRCALAMIAARDNNGMIIQV